MAGLFSTLLRGLLGVAASVLVVAMVWTLYIERDSVASMTAPVVDLVTGGDGEPAAAQDTAPVETTRQ